MDYYDYLCQYDLEFKKPVCKECKIVIEFDRKKHVSITRYQQLVFCSRQCQGKNEEMRKLYSKHGAVGGKSTWKGKHLSEEHKDKISKSVSEAYIKGFKYHTGVYKSTKTNKVHHFRSSWEHKYMQFLDADCSFVYWDYEPFIIHYEFEGRNRRYLVDFEVYRSDGSKSLIEVGVKKHKEEDPRNLAKFEAAREFAKKNGYYNFVILTEDVFSRIDEFIENAKRIKPDY
ncbi:MAG: hypothetical protein CMB80_02060 [Flammeovirgaceae bacterium]|nr:hypothetical protein [Flammeovirgaceae bacterium]